MKLMYLDLSNNSLSDLSELARLTALNYLDLSQNLISDINSLSYLKNLVVLNLNQNQILFLEPLRELKKLNSLEFSDNYVQNFEPVFDLKLFSYSHLLNQIEPDYLSLGFDSNELSQIQKLNVESDRLVHDLRMSKYENQIENGILDIKNEPKLFNIKFADTFQIYEVSLHSCTGFGFELVSNTITILKANYCNITSLQNVELMAQLVSIDLSHNHLVDISQLGETAKSQQCRRFAQPTCSRIPTETLETVQLRKLQIQPHHRQRSDRSINTQRPLKNYIAAPANHLEKQ
ncbi:leucine-rich_repeat protein [Hexamita inflata]|uniref:Leucine-rich_repeat protein n=1 Tax=Hexamita inflata TaxID=28002 RepID=A0ABP1GSQ8_9EUKA